MSNILGIDPSSACTGLAVLTEDGGLGAFGAWQPSKRVKKMAATKKGVKGDDSQRLFEYYNFLSRWVKMYGQEFEEIVVEELGVTRGANVARVLSHFQAASVLVACRYRIPVEKIKAGVARNILFGCSVTIKKEAAHELLYNQYSHIDWSRIPDSIRPDVADAFVLAEARRISSLN